MVGNMISMLCLLVASTQPPLQAPQRQGDRRQVHVPVVLVGGGERVLVAALHGDEIDLAVRNPTLGTNAVCERAYGHSRPLEEHVLQAVFMIQVQVRRRDDEAVLRVLRGRGPRSARSRT